MQKAKIAVAFTVWLTEKKPIFLIIHGDPDSPRHLLEPKNMEMFHYLWNLKWLPLLKPHEKHSPHLVPEGLAVTRARLTLFLRPVSSCVDVFSTVGPVKYISTPPPPPPPQHTHTQAHTQVGVDQKQGYGLVQQRFWPSSCPNIQRPRNTAAAAAAAATSPKQWQEKAETLTETHR